MPPRKVTWSERNMVNAVYAVEHNIISMYAAAKIYRIPRHTLRQYIKTRKYHKLFAYDDARYFENPLDKENPVEKENSEVNAEIKPDVIDTNTSWFNIQETWYCHACKIDRIADMRQCSKCCRWYHEACVGLSAENLGTFECPLGC